MVNADNIIYLEEQRMRQPWLWIILLISELPVISILGYGMVQQFVYHRPFGNRPMSDAALVVTSIVVILVSASVLVMLFSARLVTEVRTDGLYIRYIPFHRSYRKISLDNVRSIEAVIYSPIGDYGGWGIRGLANNRAYNVSGNRGVRIEYTDGRKMLIGSQSPEGLLRAIESVRQVF